MILFSLVHCTFLFHRSALYLECTVEAIPRHLVNEAVDVGNGSNAIVSMLHHFFGLQEKCPFAETCGEVARIRTPQ